MRDDLEGCPRPATSFRPSVSPSAWNTACATPPGIPLDFGRGQSARRDADGAFVGYIGYCHDITGASAATLRSMRFAARYARLSGEGFHEAVPAHRREALDLDIAFVGQLCGRRAHRGARGLGRGRSDGPFRRPARDSGDGTIGLGARIYRGGAWALSARPRTRAHGHRGLTPACRSIAMAAYWPHCAASPPLRRRGGGTHLLEIFDDRVAAELARERASAC